MRPLMLLLSLAIGGVPALERICDLRCDTASAPAPAPNAGATGHCAAMGDEPASAPSSGAKPDPCGHGHGTGALIGSAVGRSPVDSGTGPSPALFPTTVGGSLSSALGRALVPAARPAESPPGPAGSSVLRL